MLGFLGFLGWVLILSGVVVLASGLRRPAAPGGEQPAPAGRNRRSLLMGLFSLVLGGVLAVAPRIALARMKPAELSRQDRWNFNPATGPEAPVRWEDGALIADLEAGSNRYGVFPVDWNANRFRASWDITFTHLDRQNDPLTLKDGERTYQQPRSRQDYASVAVGLMDTAVANIDDRDHVAGSAIEACFSDDIRLRASDSNFIVLTSSATESGKKELDLSFKPGTPVTIELNKKYHCELEYNSGSKTATLAVTEEGGRPVVQRRLEDVKDFTNSVSWFGVSVRGYNRFDKKLDAKKGDNGYVRPRASVRIENLRYEQP
nr:hypothetical protein [uncultured bacterium]